MFLESLTNMSPELMAAGLAGSLGIGMIIFLLILTIGIYIYTSLAFFAIGKKAGDNSAWIAWIPSIGPLILANRISKKHWWPWLLLVVTPFPIIGFIASIVFGVFSIIWWWKTFNVIGKPGWWILMNFIPVVGTLIFLILIGVAAWGKD